MSAGKSRPRRFPLVLTILILAAAGAAVLLLVRGDHSEEVGPRAFRQESPRESIAPARRTAAGTAAPRFVPPVVESSAANEAGRPALERFREELARAKPGVRTKKPRDLYREEARDPVWAPAMEERLGARFEQAGLRALGLEGVNVDELDCRSSSCRVTLSWDDRGQQISDSSLRDTLRDPLVLVHYRTGPLSALTESVPPPSGIPVPGASPADLTRLRPDGRRWGSLVLLFGEDDMNPERYAAWVADAKVKNDELRQANEASAAARP